MKQQVKLLLMLRHAKSSWKDRSLDDHDRPLNKRGKRDAPRMGRLIREQELTPDAILCSTARRARDTAEEVATAAGFQGEIRMLGSLYSGDPEAYLEAVSGLRDDVDHAMLVGHNPVIEELVATLVGARHPMPTAALAVVELPITAWKQIVEAPRGRLRAHWLPRDLPDA